MNTPNDFQLTCPTPIKSDDKILLGHGSGGKLTAKLIEEIFVPAFENKKLNEMHDSAVLEIHAKRFAFTTDSYVVNPLFFPGGDIGKLAVYGTVNDLAMSGARPLYMSVGFILEEGFELDKLKKIVASMKEAADTAGIQIVTGDTKVVDRGKGDGVYINTSGVGCHEHETHIHASKIQEGDALILSGDIGRHGIAVMSEREGLEFESSIQSDCAPLWESVEACLKSKLRVHCLRDLTRGGLATALYELAKQSQLSFEVDEKSIPVTPETRGACEILGLDPFYIANEGCMIMIVRPEDAEKALAALGSHKVSQNACIIGKVKKEESARVTLKSALGPSRLLTALSGEQLPRIC